MYPNQKPALVDYILIFAIVFFSLCLVLRVITVASQM